VKGHDIRDRSQNKREREREREREIIKTRTINWMDK